jgi:hypothetical protein
MPMHALVTIIAAAGAASALAVQPPVVMPKLTPTESRELYVAAGFKPVIGGMLSTICNRPAMPRITFVDLNGDGKAEAVAIDKNAACYGEPGDWFTVLRRGSNGKWQVILRNVGVLVWEPTHTNGWMDARLTGGGQCDRLAHFDGSVYRQTSDCVAPAGSQPASVAPPTGHGVMPPAAPAGGGVRPPSAAHATAPVPAAATPPAPPPAPAAPASAPGANGITVGERAAIFKAAGFTQRGADWVGCEGQSTASIEQNAVRDLNGDGKLEAIVTEGGTACYGNTGQGFYLLTQTAPGAWKQLYSSPGIPEFLATKVNGWPELEVGGPGFCFPIERWDGNTYVFNRNHEYEPGACANR